MDKGGNLRDEDFYGGAMWHVHDSL